MPVLEVNWKMRGEKREVYIDGKQNGAREKELQQRLMGRNHGSGGGDSGGKGPRPVESRKMEGAGE